MSPPGSGSSAPRIGFGEARQEAAHVERFTAINGHRRTGTHSSASPSCRSLAGLSKGSIGSRLITAPPPKGVRLWTTPGEVFNIRDGDCFESGMDPEGLKETADVVPHCLGAQVELGGDLLPGAVGLSSRCPSNRPPGHRSLAAEARSPICFTT